MSAEKSLPPTRRDQAFSGWLDGFRWLAAAAVLFAHTRSLFLASLTPDSAASLPTRVLYVLSGYGHAAVMVFFVLSGFLVGGSVIRATREGRWSWRRYGTQRVTRLYVVLLPALLLTLAWDAAAAARTAGLTPNDDTAAAVVTSQTARDHTSAEAVAGNVAFVQTILTPTLGSNSPLWSLANEFWYYVLFPLLWIGLYCPRQRLGVRAAYLAAAAGILVLVGWEIALFFPIWLLGCVVWIAPEWLPLRQLRPRRIAVVLTAASFLAALVAARAGREWGLIVTDVLLGVSFTLLLYVLKHDRSPAAYPTARRAHEGLADFSYTLYLVHLPALVFLRACLTYETAWAPTPAAWARVGLILAGVVGYAYLVSLVTERQTDRVRRWVDGWFEGRPAGRGGREQSPPAGARAEREEPRPVTITGG
ncbi:MAG TPA: acyltransferase [Urbifossiella sp.]|jgi:peptidoglycan/LPS O-acetylase OafA/YrhL|nr:acyltransferase [Urbifossiella sp.]